jgi:hypothetical protein
LSASSAPPRSPEIALVTDISGVCSAGVTTTPRNTRRRRRGRNRAGIRRDRRLGYMLHGFSP